MALDQKTDGIWKSGKGKGRKTPKGRQVSEDAIADVKSLLGNRERRADLDGEGIGPD